MHTYQTNCSTEVPSILVEQGISCFVDVSTYLRRTDLWPFAIAMLMPVNSNHASGFADFSTCLKRTSLRPSIIALRVMNARQCPLRASSCQTIRYCYYP